MCVCYTPVTVLPNGWASKLSDRATLKLYLSHHPSLFTVSYLPGQSCCCPSDSLSRRWLGGSSRARSRPARAGLGPRLSAALDGWETKRGEVRRWGGEPSTWFKTSSPCIATLSLIFSPCCINNKLMWKLIQHILARGAAQRTGDNKQQRDIKWQVYKSDFCLPLTPPPLTLPGDTRQA